MAELSTTPAADDVAAYLDGIADAEKQRDARALVAVMREVTGEEPVIWGGTMVGFGRYRYRYRSGRTGEWFLIGFAPRKGQLTLYVTDGFEAHEGLLARLGKHTKGKSCLHVKRLGDVDTGALRELLERSVAEGRRREVSSA